MAKSVNLYIAVSSYFNYQNYLIYLIWKPLVNVHFLLLAKSLALVAPSPVLFAIVKLVFPSPCNPNATKEEPFLTKIEVLILFRMNIGTVFAAGFQKNCHIKSGCKVIRSNQRNKRHKHLTSRKRM